MADNKRCANFSKSEENYLLDLIEKYRHKIENKKSDTDANQIKKEAWHRIEKEFNSAGLLGPFRSHLVLKRKYDNIKKRAKCKYADEKKYIKGTGGGPSKCSEVTAVDEKIRSILGDQITGRSSLFDCDSENIATGITAETDEIIGVNITDNTESRTISDTNHESVEYNQDYNAMETNSVSSDLEDTINNRDSQTKTSPNWSSYTPAKLKTAQSTALQTKTNKRKVNTTTAGSLNDKICNWARSKKVTEDIKKEQLIKEQELKLEFLKDSYKLTLEQEHEKLRQSIERHQLFVEETHLRMKLMKEEHAKKMEILEIEKKVKSAQC